MENRCRSSRQRCRSGCSSTSKVGLNRRGRPRSRSGTVGVTGGDEDRLQGLAGVEHRGDEAVGVRSGAAGVDDHRPLLAGDQDGGLAQRRVAGVEHEVVGIRQETSPEGEGAVGESGSTGGQGRGTLTTADSVNSGDGTPNRRLTTLSRSSESAHVVGDVKRYSSVSLHAKYRLAAAGHGTATPLRHVGSGCSTTSTPWTPRAPRG